MTEKQIRALLEARLKTWATSRTPALPVAFENATFAPPADTYLRCYVLSGNTESVDLEGKHRGRIGVFQIDVVGMPGIGAGLVEGIVGELDTLFPNNLRLPGGSVQSVQVVSPVSKAANLSDPDRYIASVSLTYRDDSI